MMTSFFNWLRTRTRDAILAGCGDAAEAIDAGTAEGQPALDALTRRLTPDVPALEHRGANGAGAKGRKAVGT